MTLIWDMKTETLEYIILGRRICVAEIINL